MNGVPVPTLRKVTHSEPFFVDLFEKATDTARLFHWKGESLMGGEKYADILENFGHKISPNNIFEAATIVVDYSGSQTCEWHRDLHNGDATDENRSVVFSWNHKLDNGHAIALIFYMRASADSHMRAAERTNGMADYLEASYKEFEDHRRFLSPLSLRYQTPIPNSKDKASNLESDEYFRQVNPNLDPNGFISLGVMCITSMVHVFRLNMADSVSLFAAFAISNPNSMEPLARMSLDSLRLRPLPDMNVFHRFYIGYDLHRSMFRFQEGHNKRYRSRFHTYQNCSLMAYKDFAALCENIFWLFMHAWCKHPQSPAPGRVGKVYKEIVDCFRGMISGVGMLQGRHLLALSSAIGLSPPWIQECAAIDYGGKSWGAMKKKFKEEIPDSKKELEPFVSNLFERLKRSLNITPSIVENLICKDLQRRTMRKSGQAYSITSDLHYVVAPLLVRHSHSGLALAYDFDGGNTLALPGGGYDYSLAHRGRGGVC